jgi:hypothetical protein
MPLQMHECGLFLDDLFREQGDGAQPSGRRALLLTTKVGAVYEKRLHECYGTWGALPVVLTQDGAALQIELKEADAVWDWLSLACRRWGEVLAEAPPALVSAEARGAGTLLTETFVPSLKVRVQSYAKTAASGNELRAQLAAHGEALTHIPVPGAAPSQAVTMRDWAALRAETADTLARLLSERAQTAGVSLTQDQIEAARTFRSQTEGLINRLRAALADELADDAAALARLDHGIFGMLDQVVAAREAAAKSPAKPAEPVVAPPVVA